MPSTHHPMKLSRDEELFLRHWIYDEAHFRDGVGPPKRLQIEHRIIPADLATLIAAALPDPKDQAEAASTRPDAPARWPWSGNAFQARLDEARASLAAS
jgi:hypothetical protein